jgi:hypothetical protein
VGVATPRGITGAPTRDTLVGGLNVSPISPGDLEGDFSNLWLSPPSSGDSLEAEGCLLVSVIVFEDICG